MSSFSTTRSLVPLRFFRDLSQVLSLFLPGGVCFLSFGPNDVQDYPPVPDLIPEVVAEVAGFFCLLMRQRGRFFLLSLRALEALL